MLNIVKKIRAKKAHDKFVSTLKNILLSYEKDRNSHKLASGVSAVDDVMQYSNIMIKKEDFSTWEESIDYVQVANALISQTAFDLLTSGKYHLYTGMLNPMSSAPSLMHMYRCAMNYALSKGLIDQETVLQQEQLLLQQIKSVG